MCSALLQSSVPEETQLTWMLLSKEELLLSVRQGGGPWWGVNVPLGPINLHLDGQFLARCGLQAPPLGSDGVVWSGCGGLTCGSRRDQVKGLMGGPDNINVHATCVFKRSVGKRSVLWPWRGSCARHAAADGLPSVSSDGEDISAADTDDGGKNCEYARCL